MEGQVRSDGSAELIEINPRCGGGPIPMAVRHVHGLDPVDVMIRMTLPGGWQPRAALLDKEAAYDPERIGLFHVEANTPGKFRAVVTEDELRSVDGVLDAFIFSTFAISTLQQENLVAWALLRGGELDEMREAGERFRRPCRR